MNFKKLALTAAALVFSTAALATPQYLGDTTSSTALISGTVSAPTEAGYYIWNDEADTSSWHIRWTGIGANINPVSWFGSMTFVTAQLDSPVSYQFETGGIHGDTFNAYYIPTLGNFMTWEAATNNTGGVDGIDFSLTGDSELIRLALGTNLYTDSSGCGILDDCGVVGSYIFIGDELNSPDVLSYVDSNDGRSYQAFEIPVPEPSIIALFGLGLAGLGFAARRRNQA